MNKVINVCATNYQATIAAGVCFDNGVDRRKLKEANKDVKGKNMAKLKELESTRRKCFAHWSYLSISDIDTVCTIPSQATLAGGGASAIVSTDVSWKKSGEGQKGREKGL